VIEFSRGIDNLVDYHGLVSDLHRPRTAGRTAWTGTSTSSCRVRGRLPVSDYIQEIERYNRCVATTATGAEDAFFKEWTAPHPEFAALHEKAPRPKPAQSRDVLRYLLSTARFLDREENRWMQQVVQIVRQTSLYFQPQIRTKIMNEGWASYWHETLFLQDDRIAGHEVDFARVNAGHQHAARGPEPLRPGHAPLLLHRGGRRPGPLQPRVPGLLDADQRRRFDRQTGRGRDYIFAVRENLNDHLFVRNFIEQDFVDRHRLFVAGRTLDQQRMVWQWYVKSRDAGQYRQMVLDQLYHPPHITVDLARTRPEALYLVHHHEGKPLVRDFIHGTCSVASSCGAARWSWRPARRSRANGRAGQRPPRRPRRTNRRRSISGSASATPCTSASSAGS
jgi:stage V sporulation protein R